MFGPTTTQLLFWPGFTRFSALFPTRGNFSLTLMLGGALATTSTARSKRDHASTRTLGSFFISAMVELGIRLFTDEYYTALGQFVAAFSEIECAMEVVLWNISKIKSPVAQAVFSGVRADDACNKLPEFPSPKIGQNPD